MSSSKKHKHWSDRVHETVVSRNKNGQLNLVIKGGAEEVKFPFFGQVKQDKVIYHSGKIQDGEILLEVNDQSVAGLTLFDLNNLIKQARDPVRFKTVKEGQNLNKDIKHYLGQRFDKNSVDYELQAAIRDNLYLRTLPCTTRKPKKGEVDGIDYTFLTEDQFQELEKSGALLESGMFEGNYYGTPKPPPVPLSPPSIRRSNSVNEMLPEKSPTEEKRKRNKSNIEAQENPLMDLNVTTQSNENNVFDEQPPPLPPPNHLTDESPAETTSNHAQQSPTKKSPSPAKVEPSNKDDGDGLPDGWEIGHTETGDSYFIDHVNQKTSWLDPRQTSTNERKALIDCEDDELPFGWEKVEDEQYGIYYVDHIEQKTQFENPVLQAKGKLPPTEFPSQQPVLENGYNLPTNGQHFQFTSDPSLLQGDIYQVPLEKGSRGFGFTIVGGDEPEEFLQIKSVVEGGPADATQNIVQGDVIVKVNDTCVLGWTHPQVVRLFQAIPIGQIVTLEICRGYTLPFDPEDPNTSIVTTVAIRPEDRPMEDFERQLRHLNEQIEEDMMISSQNPTGYFSNNASKSLPDIADYKNYQQQPYGARYPQDDFQHNMACYPVRNTGSMTSLQSPSSAQVLQIIIKKGDNGFGFTITDSTQGQRIKQILDANRCRDFQEGDMLLEINGISVANMPHNNVVNILKECPANAEAILLIQRTLTPSPLSYIPPKVNQYEPVTPYPQPMHHMYGRRGKNHPDYGIGSENASVVSAPPGAHNRGGLHPMNAILSEFKSRHNGDMNDKYNKPSLMPGYDAGYGSGENYVDLTVVLHREHSGFGFRILGGDYSEEKVTIGAIVTSGAADCEGSLRTGDELITVDGQSVAGIGHSKVVSLMGNAARNGVVQLGIRRRVGGAQMMPAEYNDDYYASEMPSVGRLQVLDIVIHRQEHEGFGFVIISSVKASPGEHNIPHKIGRIIEGSPADRCLQLHVGDHILAVNNVDIHHLHHAQIVNLIKVSGFSISLRIVPANTEKQEHFISRSDVVRVELRRSNRGFGFGIRGGREYNMPLYVLRMADDGPAAQCGLVHVGDILMEINGQSTRDILHSQGIELIKQGGQLVHLVLRKGDGTVPELETKEHGGSMQSLTISALSANSEPSSWNHKPKTSQYNNVQMSPKKLHKSLSDHKIKTHELRESPEKQNIPNNTNRNVVEDDGHKQPKAALWLSPKKGH